MTSRFTHGVLLRFSQHLVLTVALVVASPRVAQAGMPSVGFTDVAGLRLEVISFFLLVLGASALVVRQVWNWLARDFARLPRLSYGKALGVTVLWGLLFVVVLTMISGARELMTPGAWVRDGSTYKLRSDEEDAANAPNPAATTGSNEARRRKLADLAAALAAFAAAHDGAYPSDAEQAAIPATLWQLPDVAPLSYVYLPGRSTQGEPRLLAHEPSAYGDQAWALFTDGRIESLPFDDVEKRRQTEEAP